MSENQCSASVRVPGMGFGRFHQCRRAGVFLEEGKYWCKQHAPSTVKKRRDELTRKWDAQYAAKKHGWAVQEAAAEVVEAAVRWHAAGQRNNYALIEAVKKYRTLKEQA